VTEHPGPDGVICSARGCGHAAAWAVVWNNPRIHTPDREKVWAACDQHREHLSEYLRVRRMLRRVDPLSEYRPGGAPT
jgi:hypothetical protein